MVKKVFGMGDLYKVIFGMGHLYLILISFRQDKAWKAMKNGYCGNC